MNVRIYDYNEQLVEVPMFQLLQWKHAIHLEMLGLKHSRGSVTAHVRRILSAPRNFKREELYNYLSSCITGINEQIGITIQQEKNDE